MTSLEDLEDEKEDQQRLTRIKKEMDELSETDMLDDFEPGGAENEIQAVEELKTLGWELDKKSGSARKVCSYVSNFVEFESDCS